MIKPEERQAVEAVALELIRRAEAALDGDSGGEVVVRVDWSPRRRDGHRTITSAHTYTEKKVHG